MTSDAAHSGGSMPGRLDNGLVAPAYVPLTDVAAEVGRHLLDALGRARIAAYLAPVLPPGGLPDTAPVPDVPQRLFVNADERADARTIVAAAVRALGEGGVPGQPAAAEDPLAGLDTDAAFAALIADWHVDTVAAIREAERDLSREDADWRARLAQPPVSEPVWLDDDHYVPPPPPPLPRLAAPTVLALAIIALSIVVLGLGDRMGLTSDVTLLLGIGGLLCGAGILVMRLREYHDEDDDGSAV